MAELVVEFRVGFDMGGVTNSYCKAQRSSANGEFSSTEFTYNENPPFLNNRSFEAGIAGWGPCFNPNSISFSAPGGTGAFDGDKVLRFNSSISNASMCQYQNWAPRPGDYYQLAVRVRSASGVPVSGVAAVWEIREPNAGLSWNLNVPFTATGSWQTFTANACARNAEAKQLKTEIYVQTSGQNLDVDMVEVSIANPSVCGSYGTTPSTVATTTTAPGPTTTLPPHSSDILLPGEYLRANQSLQSLDLRFRMIQQGDGNLVVYGPANHVEFESLKSGNPGAYTVMQDDGNLVQYVGTTAIWNSGTAGSGNRAVYLIMQTDGNAVLRMSNGVPIWSSYGGKVIPGPPTTVPPVIPPNQFAGTVSLSNQGLPSSCVLSDGMNAAVTMGACNLGSANVQFIAQSGGYRIQMAAGGCLSVDYTHLDATAILPGNLQAAAMWQQDCVPGSFHQTFNTEVMDRTNNWYQIVPFTTLPIPFRPCVALNTSSPQPQYAVVEFVCYDGGSPQGHWHPNPLGQAPPPIATTTTPIPPGARFFDSIETPMKNLAGGCLSHFDDTNGQVAGGTCADIWLPEGPYNQTLFHPNVDLSRCLQSISGVVSIGDCIPGAPNQQLFLTDVANQWDTLSFVSDRTKCLRLSGSTVLLALCNTADLSQLWTDDPPPANLTYQGASPSSFHFDFGAAGFPGNLKFGGDFVIEGFIEGETSRMFGFALYAGDHRGFTQFGQTPDIVHTRFTLWVNLGTGSVDIRANPTCSPRHGKCWNARPISFGSDVLQPAFFAGDNQVWLKVGYRDAAHNFHFGTGSGNPTIILTVSFMQADPRNKSFLLRPRVDHVYEFEGAPDFAPFRSNVKVSYVGDCFPSVEIMKKLAGPGYATVIAKSNLDPLAMVASSCAESTLSP